MGTSFGDIYVDRIFWKQNVEKRVVLNKFQFKQTTEIVDPKFKTTTPTRFLGVRVPQQLLAEM